jgi:hypothetical protein
MPDSGIRLAVVIAVLTIGSGVFDSFAFTYSARMWEDGRISWVPASKAAVTFSIGICLYWFAIRFLGEAGIVLPEIQTLIWFTVTIIGVSFLGGRLGDWHIVDQVLGVNVIVSMGVLITRTSA